MRDCVAVSKASGNKELAMKYIEVALSEECQSEINGTAAFPINKKSLRECNTTLYKMFKMGPEYTESTNTDSFSDIDLDDFDNRISELIARIEEVRKPIQIDMVLDTFVFDAMNSYIHGQVDKDKAIDDLIKKINIYIEE